MSTLISELCKVGQFHPSGDVALSPWTAKSAPSQHMMGNTVCTLHRTSEIQIGSCDGGYGLNESAWVWSMARWCVCSTHGLGAIWTFQRELQP